MSGRLTAACSYQHELHRNVVSVVGFELTISCSQGRRPIQLNRGQAFPHAAQSTQRESNPHFRHGEPVGFHYIMGANVLIGLSKNKRREHRTTTIRRGARTRTHVAALRVRNPRR